MEDEPSPALLAAMGFASFGAPKESKRKYNAAADAFTSTSTPPLPLPPSSKRTIKSPGQNRHTLHHHLGDSSMLVRNASSSGSNALPLGPRRAADRDGSGIAGCVGALESGGLGADSQLRQQLQSQYQSPCQSQYQLQSQHQSQSPSPSQHPSQFSSMTRPPIPPPPKPTVSTTTDPAASTAEYMTHEPLAPMASSSDPLAGDELRRRGNGILAPEKKQMAALGAHGGLDGGDDAQSRGGGAGGYDWTALRKGVRTTKGDMAYYHKSFVEDPWAQLRGEEIGEGGK